jgi:hypothetical protein
MKISSKTGTYVLEIDPSHVAALLDELGDLPDKRTGPNMKRFYRELNAHYRLREESHQLARQQETRL